MWFSSGGTRSVLHVDDVDNVSRLATVPPLVHIITRSSPPASTCPHHAAAAAAAAAAR
jgi:hypothetical protein